MDDIDYLQTADKGETEVELLQKKQKGDDLWESLLRTTGGAIVVEPTKTDWVNIAFKNVKGSMKMKPPNPEQILTVRNTDGEIVQ